MKNTNDSFEKQVNDLNKQTEQVAKQKANATVAEESIKTETSNSATQSQPNNGWVSTVQTPEQKAKVAADNKKQNLIAGIALGSLFLGVVIFFVVIFIIGNQPKTFEVANHSYSITLINDFKEDDHASRDVVFFASTSNIAVRTTADNVASENADLASKTKTELIDYNLSYYGLTSEVVEKELGPDVYYICYIESQLIGSDYQKFYVFSFIDAHNEIMYSTDFIVEEGEQDKYRDQIIEYGKSIKVG